LYMLNVRASFEKSLEVVRALRGNAAIQTIKQYNFLYEFSQSLAINGESSIHPPLVGQGGGMTNGMLGVKRAGAPFKLG